MTNIGNNAFAGADIPTVISLIENPVKIPNNTFTQNTFNNATLYVPTGAIDEYKSIEGWKDFVFIEEGIPVLPFTYNLTYYIDGTKYKSYKIEEGAEITPEPAPVREGYTFSGWSEIPATMPAHDVTVTGTFAVNSYKLTYIVDGEVYKSYDVEYGTAITPEVEPIKEGYTFSGWSEIPETMPAHDVTITGSFTLDTGVEQIMNANNGDAMIFTIDGKRVNKLKKGLNVIHMKDGTTRKVTIK